MRSPLPHDERELSLTLRDACGRVAVLLSDVYGKPDFPFENRFPVGNYHSMVTEKRYIDDDDHDLSYEQFIESHIRPMAEKIAGKLPRGVAFMPLPIPPGAKGARSYWNGISVRVLVNWSVWDGRTVMQFDVAITDQPEKVPP